MSDEPVSCDGLTVQKIPKRERGNLNLLPPQAFAEEGRNERRRFQRTGKGSWSDSVDCFFARANNER